MVLVLTNVFFLFSGFALLILSGDKLVETSIRIAQRWKVPTSVIAATIIAAGTSAPELVTSFLAGYRGSSDIAIGNLLGSNTFNILAVGGISLFLQPFGKIRGTFVSWVVLAFSTLLFYLSFADLSLSKLEAFVFLGTLCAFIVLSFFRERDPGGTFENIESKSFPRTLVFFGVSFAGLVMGAELALTGGVALGQLAGLSERVIAVTIISAGTGLPELATSVAAAFRGHSDIAIANVIGSNIINTLAIPGITASFFSLQINKEFLAFDFYVMAAATLTILLLYLFSNHSIRRFIGALMFLGYSAYAIRLLLA